MDIVAVRARVGNACTVPAKHVGGGRRRSVTESWRSPLVTPPLDPDVPVNE